MKISERALSLARGSESRYDERADIRTHCLDEAKRGNIWAADDPDRVAKRLAHVRETEMQLEGAEPALPSTTAPAFASTAPGRAGAGIGSPGAAAGLPDDLVTALALERTIGRDDLVTPQFLRTALAASRSVCRITVRSESGGLLGYGTGMLVGPGVLLTNHHVLERVEDAAQSEATFGFESGTTAPGAERIVRFEPQRFFLTDVDLDFTLVAVAAQDAQGHAIDDLGYVSLNGAEGKVINSEFVNVIQHPNGGAKMLALRENRVVDVLPDFLHYVADTAPGSSGAPVFNDQFEIVALHHSGVPARDDKGNVLNRDGKPWTSDQGESAVQWKANEGVRVSVLVERARALVADGPHKALIEQVCDPAHALPRVMPPGTQPVNERKGNDLLSAVGGPLTVTIPLSISITLGAQPGAAVTVG
ncbi:MAG: trypsin-like serine peptidase, partial [Solimonas sp.]